MKIKRIKDKMFSVLCGAVAFIAACHIAQPMFKPSDKSMISRAVKLYSEQGSCSGVQIKAPSGASYILSAGHCKVLKDKDGNIMARTEDGKQLARRVIQEDQDSDLLLIEGLPGIDGIEIAPANSPMFKHVTTYTHPSGFDIVKSEGYMIQDQEVDIMSNESPEECVGKKYRKAKDALFGMEMCVMHLTETVYNARTSPGSSGGMIVDDAGRLAGIVSAGDSEGLFGYAVRLQDIRAFTNNY